MNETREATYIDDMTDDDENDMALVDQVQQEIREMLDSINATTPEEQVIMEKIQAALKSRDMKYHFDPDMPKHVVLGFAIDNKPFRIYIIIQNGKIIYRLVFPFRVQTNAIPLMAMHIACANEHKAFSQICLDMSDGELTMEYSYILEDSDRFDQEEFFVYLTSLIVPALEEYTKLMHLSVGMITGKEKAFYHELLEQSLRAITNENDLNDEITYGTEDLQLNLHKKDFSAQHIQNPNKAKEREDIKNRIERMHEQLMLSEKTDSENDTQDSVDHDTHADFSNVLNMFMLDDTDDED